MDATKVGNISRLFNHSCDPNLQLFLVRIDSFIPRLAFFAIKDIPEGTELTFDYGLSSSSIEDEGENKASEEDRKEEGKKEKEEEKGEVVNSRMQCHCGAVNCRGWLPYDASV